MDLEQLGTSKGGWRDKVALVASALLVCVVGVGAFWIATDYHVDSRGVFFVLNAVGFIVVVGRKFPDHWKAPSFVLFFIAWLVFHGLIAIQLAASVPILYWLPIFGVELFIGFLVAYMIFGVPANRR